MYRNAGYAPLRVPATEAVLAGILLPTGILLLSGSRLTGPALDELEAEPSLDA
jgi:hypothetical protein